MCILTTHILIGEPTETKCSDCPDETALLECVNYFVRVLTGLYIQYWLGSMTNRPRQCGS